MTHYSDLIEAVQSLSNNSSEDAECHLAHVSVLRALVAHLKADQPRMFHDDFYEDAIKVLSSELRIFNAETEQIISRGQ